MKALTLARLLTIALVVTAVSAVYAVANATVFSTLPFPNPQRLVRVYFQPPGTTAFADADSLDALAFVRFREWTKTMDAVAGIFVMDRGVTGDREPESIWGGQVTEGFFDVLGASAVAGRLFTPDEFAVGAKAVVLGHGLWVRRFGSDPSVVGQPLIVDRQIHTIVGVAGPGFEPGFARSEFWTPMDLRKPNPYFSGVQTIGRLRAGATAGEAAAELNTLLTGVAREAPAAYNGWKMGTLDLKEARYGSRRPTILMLLSAVIALGLIATFNLTNLTLADLTARKHEFALRAALGGSRLDVARAELKHSLALSVAGSAIGLAAVAAIVPVVSAMDPSGLLGGRQLQIDWRVALIAVLTSAVVMGVAVVVPVLRFTAVNIASELAIGSRRAAGRPPNARLRILLVTGQVALGIALIASGASVVTTFQDAAQIDPGFDPKNVLTAQIRLSEVALPTPESRLAFIEDVVARLRETPGIVAASTTLNTFIAGLGGAQSLGFVEEHPSPDGAPYRIQSRRVTPGYFDAMRIKILQGRDFADTDRLGMQPVIIVSKSFAEAHWPGKDPINRRAKRGVTTKEWSVVIGVVDDVRDVSIDQAPRDTLYTPFLQSPPSPLPVSLVMRTERDPAESIAGIKRTIRQIDPDQPLSNVVTLDEFLRDSLGPQRFRALLVSAYAVLGLLLATLGTYAVTARAVVERRREAGVRLALGGEPRQVWWTIAAPALRAVGGGAVAGVALAWAARVAIIAALPEVQGAGLSTSAVAACALVFTGTTAASMAARAILSVDAVRALQD